MPPSENNNDDRYVVREELERSFHEVHKRVDTLEEISKTNQSRIDEMKAAIDLVTEGHRVNAKRLGRMEENFDINAKRLGRMEAHIDVVLREISNVRSEVARWAQEVGKSINLSTERLDRISVGQVALVAVVIIANFVLGLMLYRFIP